MEICHYILVPKFFLISQQYLYYHVPCPHSDCLVNRILYISDIFDESIKQENIIVNKPTKYDLPSYFLIGNRLLDSNSEDTDGNDILIGENHSKTKTMIM